MLRELIQEVRELGIQDAMFRVGWEARVRSGLAERLESPPPTLSSLPCRPSHEPGNWPEALFFPSPQPVVQAVAGRITESQSSRLLSEAQDAAVGRIICFGRWQSNFGYPIDWQRNPLTNARWNETLHWTETLGDEPRVGDIKLTWEVARFPHAYQLARAAAHHPEAADDLAAALANQIERFVAANPWGQGIHWGSGQEIAFRLMAWLFAFDVLLSRSGYASRMAELIGDAILAGATHVEQHLDYARRAVYNNHLLSEAVALLLGGALFPASEPGLRWRRLGWRILEEEAERQFYLDGAYIQQSHNYHRVALQDLLWACLGARMLGEQPATEWVKALERSLDFLLAQQNPMDGRLPNYGSNDGALPSPLTSCDFSDFRPTLQTLSLLTRGERVYPPGPWDEEAAWLLGPRALDAPIRTVTRSSVSFAESGYHVLQGCNPGNFGTFRCGSLRNRFSQIDMLQLDVWWRGLNVLVDGGSYLYNGPAAWHEHFFQTASHNTLTVDGRDQMLHHRRFKVLYWTEARLLAFRVERAWAVAAGEHYGYRRHPGLCVHRRSVLFVKDDLWVVADTVLGEGSRAIRLHWLGGEFPFAANPERGSVVLATPEGDFGVAVWHATGEPALATLVAGQETPPRGWLSRYYGEKVSVPSLAVMINGNCPVTLVSVLGAGQPQLHVNDGCLEAGAGDAKVAFRLVDGLFDSISS